MSKFTVASGVQTCEFDVVGVKYGDNPVIPMRGSLRLKRRFVDHPFGGWWEPIQSEVDLKVGSPMFVESVHKFATWSGGVFEKVEMLLFGEIRVAVYTRDGWKQFYTSEEDAHRHAEEAINELATS